MLWWCTHWSSCCCCLRHPSHTYVCVTQMWAHQRIIQEPFWSLWQEFRSYCQVSDYVYNTPLYQFNVLFPRQLVINNYSKYFDLCWWCYLYDFPIFVDIFLGFSADASFLLLLFLVFVWPHLCPCLQRWFAYTLTLNSCSCWAISEVTSINSIGPKTLPCGTPDSTVVSSDRCCWNFTWVFSV